MGWFQFQAKLMAATLVAFLLVGDAPVYSVLLHNGFEEVSPFAFDSKVGSRKMDPGVVSGSFNFASLRAKRVPSPPPPPARNRKNSSMVMRASPPPPPPPLCQ